MPNDCHSITAIHMKRWLSAIVGIQCFLLLVFLILFHSSTEKKKTLKDSHSKYQRIVNKTLPQREDTLILSQTEVKNKQAGVNVSHVIQNSMQAFNAVSQNSSGIAANATQRNTSNSVVSEILNRTPTVASHKTSDDTTEEHSVGIHKTSDNSVDKSVRHSENHTVLSTMRPASIKQKSHSMEENSESLYDLKAGSLNWNSPWPPRGILNQKKMLYSKTKSIYSRQFPNYDLSNPPDVTLVNDTVTEYVFHPSHSATCMSYGAIKRNSTDTCSCKEGWTGVHCSIPVNVANSYSLKHSHSRPEFINASPARRVINALSFNIEWDLLETRMNELGLVVDLFVITESNYTMYGDSKPLHLLQRLQRGYLKEFHHKIMYVLLDHFPDDGKEDGWIVERYQRNYLGQQCLKRLKGSMATDLFMYTDADEIPSFESVLFLKLHTGYSEPVGFYLGWSVYGFFWKNVRPTDVISVCTFKFFSDVLMGDIQSLRMSEYTAKYPEALKQYNFNMSRLEKKDNVNWVFEWYIGISDVWAGWHCSWCLPVDHIKVKLTSAINADFPRWGDYPSKRELPYIKQLVQTGLWFDDETRIGDFAEFKNDTSFAPTYLLTHYDQYLRILDLKHV